VDERPSVYDWVKLRERLDDVEPGTRGVVVAYTARYDEALVQFLGAAEPKRVPVDKLEML
jgi:hypothetical protein